MSTSMAEIHALYSPNTGHKRRSVRTYKGKTGVCNGNMHPFDIFNTSSFKTKLWWKPAFINLT